MREQGLSAPRVLRAAAALATAPPRASGRRLCDMRSASSNAGRRRLPATGDSRASLRKRRAICARIRRQVVQRPVLALHHVRVKIRRTPHGLAGVVDDEIQPRMCRQQMLAKRLHARRVAQIESENLQPMSPVLEIRLGGVTHRRVARKTRA